MVHSENEKRYISKRVGRNVLGTTPKVSVVIPAYNASEHICETLDSVLGQKFREHEIIVVNDGSPDTQKFERAIKTKLDDIVYLKQRNAGAGVARNTGIEHARGEIIAFLDSDDVWLPDYLASQYVFLQRNSLDMVYCDALLFGMRSAYRKTFMETSPSEGDVDFDALLDLRCNVITSGTLVRRRTLIKAGLFETKRVQAEDFHLWLRIAKSGAKIGYQRKQLLKYRVHLNGLSGDTINQLERAVDAFSRVSETIDLTESQRRMVANRLAELESSLAVERGKVMLLRGEFRDAAESFSRANDYRRSMKITAIGLMTRFAPRTLLKFYRSNRASEIALARGNDGSRSREVPLSR